MFGSMLNKTLNLAANSYAGHTLRKQQSAPLARPTSFTQERYDEHRAELDEHLKG